MTSLNERGENFEKLVARLVSLKISPPGSDMSIGAQVNRMKALLAQPGIYNALWAEGVDGAEAMVQLMRTTKEGHYRMSSDETIATVIMEAIRDRERNQSK